MNPNVLIAAIGAGGSVLVSITALILAYRGFASIDARFASLERRLEVIEADLKPFYRTLAEFDKRIQRLEDKS